MEVKILDSIIHGDLKPWKINTTDTRRFTELVKAANAASPKTNAVLLSQLTALFADSLFPPPQLRSFALVIKKYIQWQTKI